MGPGGSQDAAFKLRASVPAGTYHVVCDAVITASVDTTFTLIWRRGASDTRIALWTKTWAKNPENFDAQAYEMDVTASAIDFRAGDELVFRYEATRADGPQAFIPNGDGNNSHGRIPNITLP